MRILVGALLVAVLLAGVVYLLFLDAEACQVKGGHVVTKMVVGKGGIVFFCIDKDGRIIE